MRAIIPVAGIGTRLRPHTYTVPKVLLHVAGKPILGHILDEMKEIGITDLSLIIGYKGELVKQYVDANYDFNTHYIVQDKMEGLGHAIWLSSPDQKGDEPGLIILGDTIFKADLKPVMKGGRSMLGVKEVEDARRFGVIEKSPKGRITRLVEKAEKPPTNLAIVGIYFISDMPLLYNCLQNLIDNDIRTKGEFQLTDALQGMIEKGHDMGYFEIEGWYDCGKPETLLATNRALLDMKPSLHVKPGNPNIKNSVIRQPVVVEETAVVEDSIIGPYASLSAGCQVKSSIVKDSVLSTNVAVQGLTLDRSIISDNATVSGRPHSVNIGDSSEVQLGG